MTDTTSGTMPDLRPGRYTLDAKGSTVGFQTRNFLGLRVNGQFRRYQAEVRVGDRPEHAAITVTIPVAGVDTKSKLRDRDLLKKKILDAATWPELTFTSTEITSSGSQFTLTGDLTVRDQTRRVTLVGRHTGTTARGARFTAELVVNPRDFGVSHPTVRKSVTVHIEADLVPAE